MKKIITILFLSAQIFVTTAQSYTIDLQVASLSEMDFAPFIFSNDLSGAPRIFAVNISPEEGNVKVRGELFWKKDINSSFEWLLTFRTKVFQARSFFNTDLGTSIPLGKGESDSDLIEENRKRGKPTGKYKLIIYLLDESGKILTDSENNELIRETEYEFSNPAQTLTILSPQQNSLQNIGGVLAEWTELSGIDYYQVRANSRADASESLEEALESGDPLINNVQVGLTSSIDLRTILSREWLPGQEIVFQVSAMPTGGAPSDLIPSNIVSFYLDDPANPISNFTSDNIGSILQSLQDGLGSDLLDKLLNGDVLITEIQWEDTGLPLTPEEIQMLLEYLRQNPNNLINIEQD